LSWRDKPVLVATAVASLAALALRVEVLAAQARTTGQLTCRDVAKLDYPNDRQMRRAFQERMQEGSESLRRFLLGPYLLRTNVFAKAEEPGTIDQLVDL
jgi:hypothetical protein